MAGLFRGPTLCKTISLARLRELVKIPFSKGRFISFVDGETIEGIMNSTTIVGMQSGPDDKEPSKLFTTQAALTSEARPSI